MIVLIPLGGFGTRFKEQGYDTIKPMIPIHGKPILYYLLETLSEADFIYIPYNKLLGNSFEKQTRQAFPHLNFLFLSIDKTRGAAETVFIALEKLDCFDMPVLCLDGDAFYTENIYDMWKGKNLLFCQSGNDNPAFSYIAIDENLVITDIKEKQVISDMACTGTYGFNSFKMLRKYCGEILKNNIMDKGEFYLSTAIGQMIKDGIQFSFSHVDSIISLGTPNDILKFYDVAILFDLDGTLVSTDEAYIHTWNELLGVDKQWFDLNIKGKSDMAVFSKFGYTNDLSDKKDTIFSRHLDKITPIPGAIQFVSMCNQQHIPCAVVTNCNERAATEILNHYNFQVDLLVIGDKCEKPKPYPHPYIYAQQGLKKTKMTLVFEDTPTGIQSAKASGVSYVVGVTTSFTADILVAHGADFCIPDFQCDIFTILGMIENDRIVKVTECTHLEKECCRILKGPVVISRELIKGGYIANIQKVTANGIEYIIKRENSTNHIFSKISRDLALYEREYYFYERIAHLVPLKIPRYFGTIYKDNQKKGIILENLDSNYTFNPVLDENGKKLVIQKIANMHKMFENTSDFDLVCSTDSLFKDWYQFCLDRWPKFVEKWTGVLTETQLALGKMILDNFPTTQKVLSQAPLTLVHGDIKIPNIAMYKNGTNDQEPYFLDWQYIVKGKGIQDIAFLLVESFEIDEHSKILGWYSEYMGQDNNMADFKNALAYFPFYVALWFGTVDDKDLIDVTFPKKYVPKLFKIYEYYK